MFEERNRAYFARREAEERAAAKAATTSEARIIHLQMAYHYAALGQREEELEAVSDARPAPSRGRA